MNSIMTTTNQETNSDILRKQKERERSLLFDENWRLLATAIVTQAGAELKECKNHIEKLRDELETEEDLDKRASKFFRIKKYEGQMESIKRFFNSQWFEALAYVATGGEVEQMDFSTIERCMNNLDIKHSKKAGKDVAKSKQVYHKKGAKNHEYQDFEK